MSQLPQTVLSIVIPTLNEAETLPPLLDDLGKQRDISVEIIIGDGGSTDSTRAVAEAYDVAFVSSRPGRGAQMNAAARLATGEHVFFLHADSRMDDPHLLHNAVRALTLASHGSSSRVAGHFCLRFMRSTNRNAMAYRYTEGKTAFNRTNTTNGDQGLLLSMGYYRELGGFDESMPYLEDQRLAEKIRSQGTLITLPGYLKTSARRFEAEGFHRRYILMSMMMGLHSIGADAFFARAPGIYQVQQDTGTLLLSPFFCLVWSMMRDEWGVGGTIKTFYLLGRYIRQNSWQIFFFLDVWLRPLLGVGRYPFLKFHDRVFGPCTNFAVFNAVAGMICFLWFMGILFPFFWLIDHNGRTVHSRHETA